MANRHERATTQKRKQVLETLSGLVQKKRKTLDANEQPDATDQSRQADDAVSATSSAIPAKQKRLSEGLSTSRSSSLEKRNVRNGENQAKSRTDEHYRHDLSSRRKPVLESGRSSSTNTNSKQCSENHKRNERGKERPFVVGSFPSRSKRRSRPSASQGMKWKFADDNNPPGPVSEANSDNVPGPVVDAAVVQVSGNSNSEPSDDITSEPSSQQFCVQETEHNKQQLCPPLLIPEREGLSTDVGNKPLPVITAEPECLYDEVDPFKLSPPRQVRLKFRDGIGSKLSADYGEQTTPTVTDTSSPSSAKPCRSSNSRSQRQVRLKFRDGIGSKLSADSSEQTTPTVTDTSSPSSPKPCRSSNSRSPNSKQLPEDSVENFKQCRPGSRPPVLGRFPPDSKQPSVLKNVERKSSANVSSLSGPYRNSETENKYYGGKKHSVAQNREYGEARDRNDYSHYRGRFSGERTHSRSPMKRQFRLVAERSETLDNDRQEDRYNSRCERENEFKSEPIWCEEGSWQDRGHGSRENRWSEREYTNRCGDDSVQQQGRVFDLRDKLNMRHRGSNRQRKDEECYKSQETHGRFVYDDQERSHNDDSRRCPLRVPPHYEDDECYVVGVDRNYNSAGRAWRGDSTGRLRGNSGYPQDDAAARMDTDLRRWRQPRDYGTSSVKQEPQSDWGREVSQISNNSSSCT